MYVHVWWNQIHIRSETSNVLDFKCINIWLKDDVDLQRCHLWANNEFKSLKTINVFYLCDIKIRKCSWFMISFPVLFWKCDLTFCFSVPSFTCPLPSSLHLHLIPCSCVFVLPQVFVRSFRLLLWCHLVLSCVVSPCSHWFVFVFCLCDSSLFFLDLLVFISFSFVCSPFVPLSCLPCASTSSPCLPKYNKDKMRWV